MTRWVVAAIAASGLAACGGEEGGGEGAGAGGEYEFFSQRPDGKADIAKKAHIIDNIELQSTITGTFRPEVRAYGYTFEAKADAIVHADVSATGGEGSDLDGKALDMIIGLYGPMNGDQPGERLAYVDESDEAGAQLPGVKIPRDGKYMVVFGTWDHPGKGSYQVDTRCEGTDFQCRRPIVDAPCEAGTRYIEGDTVIDKDETWSTCNVVLLEPTTIGEGITLTIKPGVTVQGNFLDLGGRAPYGDVALKVKGRLQAVGTEKHPVVFTALKDGWQGLELYGSSNHLEHVYVENARIGIAFKEGSTPNAAKNLNVNSSLNAIWIEKGAAVDIEDVVITGLSEGGAWKGSGIVGREAAPSKFVRSLVSGYAIGIDLAGSEFEFLDSTITKNKKGIEITGNPLDLHEYPFMCPPPPQGNAGVSRSTPTPARWGLDPAFRNCDIIGNEEIGLKIRSPELLIIESSNVTGNGKGIEIYSTALHPESHIRGSNIHDNGTGPQVDAWHVVGTLDISDNFWNAISDPELSASWSVKHSLNHTCTHHSGSYGRPTGNGWTCNGTNSNWNCTATVTAGWEGAVNFTGFSPTALEAGPRVHDLTDHVQQARQQAGLR
jgi:hypothetical protein